MAKLTEKTIDALLDNLAGDDGFRERFQRNPREATASLGTDDPAVASLPQDPIKELAPKEAIKAARAALRRKLIDSMGPFQPITLDIPR